AEFHDARVGVAIVAVGDEDVAVGRGDHRGRLVERVGTIAGDAGLAEGQQHFALGTEFEDLVPLAVPALAVRYPDVAVTIDVHAVGEDEHAGAEAAEELPRGIELQNRRIHLAGAGVGAATLAHPDAARSIHRHRAQRSPRAALGHFGPVRDHAVWIRQRILGLRGQ